MLVCDECQVLNYIKYNGGCMRCGLIMSYCLECINNSTCVKCELNYFSNLKGLCMECNTYRANCH